MSFDTLIRNLMPVADALTESLRVSVTHRRVTSRNSSGKPTAVTDTTVTAIYEEKLFRPRVVGGVERVPSGKLTFTSPLDVLIGDSFIFADGRVGHVLDVEGVADPDTQGTTKRFATVVYIGDISYGTR